MKAHTTVCLLASLDVTYVSPNTGPSSPSSGRCTSGRCPTGLRHHLPLCPATLGSWRVRASVLISGPLHLLFSLPVKLSPQIAIGSGLQPSASTAGTLPSPNHPVFLHLTPSFPPSTALSMREGTLFRCWLFSLAPDMVPGM